MSNIETASAFEEYQQLENAVNKSGGWNNYYMEIYAASLVARQKKLPSMAKRPPLPQGARYLGTVEDELLKIEQIQTLFALHAAFCAAGYDARMLFLSLAHTLDYYHSVLAPMLQMVKADHIEEAWTLFQQPRRHHR